MSDIGVEEVHWQYCAGSLDISGNPYALEDADEVRAWQDAYLLVAVVRDGGRWVIEATDGMLPDAAARPSFGTPVEALEWLRAAWDAPEHVSYPHLAGTLYGCPGCLARCSCADGFTCVSCAVARERRAWPWEEEAS